MNQVNHIHLVTNLAVDFHSQAFHQHFDAQFNRETSKTNVKPSSRVRTVVQSILQENNPELSFPTSEWKPALN